MLTFLYSAVALAFVFLVLYGALSDLSTFRIPNWVPYFLAALFIVQSVIFWGYRPPVQILAFAAPAFLVNLGIGLLVFIVSFIFWTRGYIGGGDAKYLVATSLWMGPVGVVQFMVLVSALSVLMAVILKGSANWGFLVHEGRLPAFVKRLYAKLEDNKLPFGFPIGIAALIMVPEVFDL